MHFIDSNGKVTYQTRGGSCWTLNYTQFRESYIFFGLAGAVIKQYGDKPIPIKKVEARFAGRTETAVPSEEIISYINLINKGSRVNKNPQGCIMTVKGREMPEDFYAVLGNGDKIFLSGIVIEICASGAFLNTYSSSRPVPQPKSRILTCLLFFFPT